MEWLKCGARSVCCALCGVRSCGVCRMLWVMGLCVIVCCALCAVCCVLCLDSIRCMATAIPTTGYFLSKATTVAKIVSNVGLDFLQYVFAIWFKSAFSEIIPWNNTNVSAVYDAKLFKKVVLVWIATFFPTQIGARGANGSWTTSGTRPTSSSQVVRETNHTNFNPCTMD